MNKNINYVKKNDQPIKSAISDFLHRNKKFELSYLQDKIKVIWSSKMGPLINQYTTSIALRGKVLYIKINSASLKQELNSKKAEMLLYFTEELDGEYIERVEIQ